MAMGKRMPMSPKAPATSQRVKGHETARFSTLRTVLSTGLPRAPRRHRTNDHHLGRFDEGGGRLARLQAEVADGVAGDDGRDRLTADVERHLAEQADRLDPGDAPDELIAPADEVLEPGFHHASRVASRCPAASGLPATAAALAEQQAVNLRPRDPVMSARGLHGLDPPAINPLLEGGIAHTQLLRGFAQMYQLHGLRLPQR